MNGEKVSTAKSSQKTRLTKGNPCCKRLFDGSHTQKCKDYRRRYYLKNKEKLLIQIKSRNIDKETQKRYRQKHSKYFKLYSRYYYAKKRLQDLDYNAKVYAKRIKKEFEPKLPKTEEQLKISERNKIAYAKRKAKNSRGSS